MSDLFHIQTRRLWSAVNRGDVSTVSSALNKGASVNSWRLHAGDNYALNKSVKVEFFQRPILAAALANQYDIVNALMLDPKIKLNAVYAVKPSFDCSINILAGTCEVFGGWDDVIQNKFSKLKRPRRFFFSLEDIVRLNKDSKKSLRPSVSQIKLTPDMTLFLEKKLKKQRVAIRNSIPNLADVFYHLFDRER